MYIRPNEFVDIIAPAAAPPVPAPAPTSAMATIEAAIAIALLAAMIPVMLLYWVGIAVVAAVQAVGRGVDHVVALLHAR